MLDNWDVYIQKQEDEMIDYQEDLEALISPFSNPIKSN